MLFGREKTRMVDASTALPAGVHAAESIARLVRGEAPHPFRFGFVIQCIFHQW